MHDVIVKTRQIYQNEHFDVNNFEWCNIFGLRDAFTFYIFFSLLTLIVIQGAIILL